MSVHGVLGESTSYPKTYDPKVLYPIARALGRDDHLDVVFCGVDIWQVFELSWLNGNGVSQVAMARLTIPADSLNLVESKSLKLYFNSLNFSSFASVQTLKATIAEDLSACVGAPVGVEVIGLDDVAMALSKPAGVCIDNALDGAGQVALSDDIQSDYLGVPIKNKAISAQAQTYTFYSNLLRSNCPVTNQPDWGTLSVTMRCHEVPDYQAILRYILSFRQHNGFHEQCVERIFADLTARYTPEMLMVQANYTRRGGIDINPIRVSDADLLNKMSFGRLVRQ